MSKPVEAPADPFPKLRRMRDASRETLAAIEREDWEDVGRLAAETDALVASNAADFAADGPPTTDRDGLLDDVRRMNSRILRRLEERRDETLAEASRVAAARARLRAMRIDEHDEGGLDRTS